MTDIRIFVMAAKPQTMSSPSAEYIGITGPSGYLTPTQYRAVWTVLQERDCREVSWTPLWLSIANRLIREGRAKVFVRSNFEGGNLLRIANWLAAAPQKFTIKELIQEFSATSHTETAEMLKIHTWDLGRVSDLKYVSTSTIGVLLNSLTEQDRYVTLSQQMGVEQSTVANFLTLVKDCSMNLLLSYMSELGLSHVVNQVVAEVVKAKTEAIKETKLSPTKESLTDQKSSVSERCAFCTEEALKNQCCSSTGFCKVHQAILVGRRLRCACGQPLR